MEQALERSKALKSAQPSSSSAWMAEVEESSDKKFVKLFIGGEICLTILNIYSA